MSAWQAPADSPVTVVAHNIRMRYKFCAPTARHGGASPEN